MLSTEMILFFNKPLNELVFIKNSKKYCLYESISLAFLAQCLRNTSGFFLIGNYVSFSLFLDVLSCINTILSFNAVFSTISKSTPLSFYFLWCNIFCRNVEKVL